MSTWIKFAVALVIGLGLGLSYGLIIDPAEYTDATPGNLSADYRTDFILMLAEAYQGDQDSEIAARRLALLGSVPPAQLVDGAIEYARSHNFSDDEITLLQGLLSAMQMYQPVGGQAQ
jgi:hypothetical protein